MGGVQEDCWRSSRARSSNQRLAIREQLLPYAQVFEARLAREWLVESKRARNPRGRRQ